MKSAYQHLRERILDDFWKRQTVPVGFKLPTEREMERRYQVSRPTISKAIAALAAEGWVTKRQGSGIYVAALTKGSHQTLAQQERRRVGFVAHETQSALSHRALVGFEHVARTHGFGVEFTGSGWDYQEERSRVASMREHGVHGIVLFPTVYRPRDEDYLAKEFRDFPIVVADLYQPAMKRPHFIFDNYQAGREMTQFLLAQGRREIAFLKFSDAVLYRPVDDRLLGYRRALEDAGVPFVPERVLAFEGNASPAEHRAALDRFLALQPRPTALIALYDQCAHMTIDYLRQQGVAVPDDVVVVGFDNLQDESWGEWFPTTQPDFVRMGERAAEMLLERIPSRNFEPTEVVLPCPLLLPEAASFKLTQWAAKTGAALSVRGRRRQDEPASLPGKANEQRKSVKPVKGNVMQNVNHQQQCAERMPWNQNQVIQRKLGKESVMKRSTRSTVGLVLGISLLALAASPTSEATLIIANGGFETGPILTPDVVTDWRAINAMVDDSDPYQGANAALLSHATGGFALIDKELASLLGDHGVVPGQTYTFSFALKQLTGGSSSLMELVLNAYVGDSYATVSSPALLSSYGGSPWLSLPNPAAYTTYTYNVTIPTDNPYDHLYTGFRVNGDSSTPYSYLVDAVSITAVAVPEPGTMVLMGLGGLIALWARRQRVK